MKRQRSSAEDLLVLCMTYVAFNNALRPNITQIQYKKYNITQKHKPTHKRRIELPQYDKAKTLVDSL